MKCFLFIPFILWICVLGDNEGLQTGEINVAPLPMADFLELSNVQEEVKTSNNMEDQMIDKDSQGNNNELRSQLELTIDEDFSLPNVNDEAVDRWEAVPLQLTESELARDSEAVLKEDEAGSGSLTRQELLEEMNAMKDFMDLQETAGEEGEEKNSTLDEEAGKKPEEDAVGGLLEIYNVDDFDEKFDDETLMQA